MVDECPTISYLSKKLETIPLTDYFFKKRQDHNNIEKKCLFKTKSTTKNSSKTAWKFDFSTKYLNENHNTDNEFSAQHHVTTETILKTTHQNISLDANVKNTTKVDECAVVGSDSIVVNSLATTNQYTKSSHGNVESEKVSNRDIMSYSPVFSDSLPTESCLKTSPFKRKRSADEFLYGDVSFSKSCDLQITRKEFGDIQRTLSFDEELLRYDEEIAAFTSRSTSASSLRQESRCRPSIRLTCRSQPSTLENFRLVHPKVRKVKMLQTASDNLESYNSEINDREIMTSSCRGGNITSKMKATTTRCFQPINLPPDE